MNHDSFFRRAIQPFSVGLRRCDQSTLAVLLSPERPADEFPVAKNSRGAAPRRAAMSLLKHDLRER
jgi:hypothetical protein